jgi:hypothetical protein
MTKNVLILALVVLVAFLGACIRSHRKRAVRVTARDVPPSPILSPADISCLRTVQTRTSWSWHLYFVVTAR